MKILLIGHFHNYPSGWSQASLGYMNAMHTAGLDVVVRSLKLNNNNPTLPDLYYELEAKDDDGCDVVIQHVLPHHLQYDGRFKKNIALCVYEHSGWWTHNWAAKINMMDELWAPSTFTKRVFKDGGVVVPINVVPHAFDMNKYAARPDKLNVPELNGDYIFYTIADLNTRKNLTKLIQAFHYEFTVNEPVSLMIKTSKHGVSPETTFNVVKNDIDKIKQDMKLYKDAKRYKPEFLITSELSETEIAKIHGTGNCYVNVSHGEAFCIPLFEAMAYGNQIICPEDMYDFATHNSTIPTYDDICFRCNDTLPELSSSREIWKDMSVLDIAWAMRATYNNRNNDTNMRAVRMAKSHEYSYQNIGQQITSLLETPHG